MSKTEISASGNPNQFVRWEAQRPRTAVFAEAAGVRRQRTWLLVCKTAENAKLRGNQQNSRLDTSYRFRYSAFGRLKCRLTERSLTASSVFTPNTPSNSISALGIIKAHRESDHIHHENDPDEKEAHDALQRQLRDYKPFPDRCWNAACSRLRDASTDLSTVPATAANLVPDPTTNSESQTTNSESNTATLAAAYFLSNAATNARGLFAFWICVTTGDRQSGTLTMYVSV